MSTLFVNSCLQGSGFCFVRLITFSTRLAWGVRPENASLALVSNIFLNAGIPILYIINLVFAHRITRAQHPRLGWHRSLSILGRVVIGLILMTLVMLIYAGVQSAYTQSGGLQHKIHDIQLYGSTFNTVIAILPLPMLLLGIVIPRRVRTEKFGSGRFRLKIGVLIASSLLLTLRTAWGTTLTWIHPVHKSQPMPWYLQKAIFYTVQLLTELIVVYMFIFVRINRIFYTPDGLPRGSYVDLPKSTAQLHTPPPYAEHDFPTVTTLRVYSEEELFEDGNALTDTLHYSSTSLLLDNSSGKWKLERQSVSDVYSPGTYQPSERASTRESIGSHYYYTPVTASAETSPAPSVYTPSTWNKERYNKEKDRRDSVKSGYSSPSPRWSGQGKGKEVELKKYSYHKPSSEVTEIQWPLPKSDVKPMGERMSETEHAAKEARMERLASVGTGGSFQDRVDRIMKDSQHAATVNTANTIRVRSPRPRTISPPRMSSVAPPPIPEMHISAPKRAVSQPPRSPVVRQSFEDAMFE
jgi:hypothetical protein